jgi:HK97 gp10 family phage protein
LSSKPFTLELEGLQKTINGLRKVKDGSVDRVDNVLENAVVNIAGIARRLAPVYKGKVGGALRKSIQSGRVVKLTWEVVAGVYYVEFGTGGLVDVPKGLEKYALQFKKSDDKRFGMKAQPFLFPAFMVYRRQLIKDLRQALEKPR